MSQFLIFVPQLVGYVRVHLGPPFRFHPGETARKKLQNPFAYTAYTVYASPMDTDLNVITITRKAAGGRYVDVIEAAQRLKLKYGSATNAVVAMCRTSPEFRALQNGKAKRRKKK